MRKKANNPKETTYDIESYRRKKKREKRVRRLLQLLAVLLLVGGAAGFFYLYSRYDLGALLQSGQAQSDASASQSGTVQTGSFPVYLDAVSPLEIELFGDGMILLTNEEAAVLGGDGSVSSQFVHTYTNPVLWTGDSRYLLYDRGGYGYRVQNARETIAEGRTTDTILSGACGHDSTFALVTSASRYAGSVQVYGKNGRELLSWYSSEQIIDLAFSPDDRYLAVATVVFDNAGSLNARVHLFDLDREEEVASADFSDAVPLAVNILEGGAVHLVTDTFLGILSEDFSEQSKVPYLQTLRKYQFSHTATLLVTSSANEVSSTLSLVSENGEKKEQTVRNSVTDVSLSSEGLCVLAGGSARVYSPELEMVQTEQVANDVFQILYSGGEIYTMSSSMLDQLSRASGETDSASSAPAQTSSEEGSDE